MPHLRIETNVPRSKIPEGLAKDLCKVLATSLGKPLEYCVVSIIPDTIQSWGATDEPSAQAIIMSIGQLGTKENIAHSKAVFAVVTKALGIDPTRMYIHFQDAKSLEVGYNGTTFYEIFGK